MIQKIKISEVKLNPNNPRLIKDDKFKKLVKSIKDFPQMLEIRPIVVNKDMIILGGNMRYKACKEVGLKEISIIIADNLTPEQEREFLIKDNTSGGEWDWDILANEWNSAQLEDWGMDNWKNIDDKELFDSQVEDTGAYDFPEDNIENSHVKMVQLFLNDKTEPNFREWELSLRNIHGTDNLTDTVYSVLKKAYKEYDTKSN